ncbi:MAG: NAD(P)/FAD-dependent oxidoreductase [Geminicoccaceae bacterium]
MRAIVVGGGIMGLCTAWALCRGGHEAVVYEQGPIPNPFASSCDEHRLTRFTYGAMTGYARMVHEAHAAWDRLWGDLGRSHFRPTGTLVVARADGWVRASERCLEAMALPVEIWSPEALAARLPFLTFEHASFALFTPTGGVLFARRILEDLDRWLRRHGVALNAHSRVTAIDPDRAAIRMADGRSDRGDALVVAAGPWAPDLVPTLRGRITPSRQTALYLEPPPETLPVWRAAPMVLDQIEAARGGFYAVPPIGGTRLKVGDHGFSLRGHPDLERAPSDADRAHTMAVAGSRLVDFERYRALEARTCFYSIAAGERFIVEPLGRAWVLAGFSGHGFKFGAVIGEAIALALAGRRSAATITAWAAGRA